MFAPAEVSTIAATIQLAVAPVFLLAAIGAFLGVLAGRLGRVIDRARVLELLHPASTGPEHDRHVWELRLLDRRVSVVSSSIALLVSSAVAVCTLIALLFISQLADFRIGQVVALVFVLAMALLVAALLLFLLEVRLALTSTHVRGELLERDR